MFSSRQTWIPIPETYQPFIVTANVGRLSAGSGIGNIRIQVYSGTPNIDWGDGNFTTVSTPGIYTKLYANTTTNKTITINSPTSNIGFKFTDANRVIDVVDFGTIPISNASNMFANARGLTTLTTTRTPNFEGNTDVSYMLSNANTFVQNISNWDMSKVSNTSFMFRGANLFNIDIGSWDMRNVANIAGMFNNAFNFNNGGSDSIKNWNISNVTNMSSMFSGARAFNQPVGGWNPANVVTASSMFNGANVFNNGGNSSWAGWANANNLTDVTSMFQTTPVFNQPVGEINMSKVTNMTNMFAQAVSFNNGGNTNINNWNTANVTTMSATFSGADAFNQDIGNWNVAKVQSMGVMFVGANLFNNGGSSSINNWNTANLDNAYAMFSGAESFNQPLGDWNTSKFYVFAGVGTSADSMFNGCVLYNQNLSSWCVPLLPSLPINFATGTPMALVTANLPVWGTCPP
jgi:surface protein